MVDELMNFHTKHGLVDCVHKMFVKMPKQVLPSWISIKFPLDMTSIRRTFYGTNIFPFDPGIAAGCDKMYVRNVYSRCIISEALRIFSQIRKTNVRPDLVEWTARIKACDMLLELVKIAMVDIVSGFGQLLVMAYDSDLLFENGKVDEAISIWEQLPTKDCVVDSTTYGVSIFGLCTKRYLSKALQILKEIEYGGSDLDIFAYSSMISSLYKKERLDDAASVVREMDKHGCKLDSRVCNALFDGFLQAYRFEGAVKLFKEISIKGKAGRRVET
ncbi:putative pentatricopeptide repeat-containing protein At1g53330 [Tripterygium wilfordii]|uniref:putative pentatricopeptide repeat-containing protein At1g53330 n=1 Tax=Tripterygium wilfordii TaxID=458696 RepID=UPI0018F80C0D|nr:putative pentatricopeptide repeat-containing protein At1g53330 [Tripterygium wilfordii]